MTVSESCALVSPCFTGSRISTSVEVPKFCTAASLKPIWATVSLIWPRFGACGYLSSITVPPVKSTPRCNPRIPSAPTAIRNVSSEITLKISAWRMKGMSRWILKNSIYAPDFACAAGFQTCPIETFTRRRRLP
jgi:hypothetical protein